MHVYQEGNWGWEMEPLHRLNTKPTKQSLPTKQYVMLNLSSKPFVESNDINTKQLWILINYN